MQDLQQLFLNELADMYSAEKQLMKALPKMAKAANSPELRDAFEEHLAETEEQVERLEQVFDVFDRRPKAKKCEAMAGLVKEGDEIAKEFKKSAALDAGLISAAQKVEHYEIASYGCLCTWAEQLGHREALRLLKENLNEEKEADDKLTELAETNVNLEAAIHDGSSGGRTRRGAKSGTLARAR